MCQGQPLAKAKRKRVGNPVFVDLSPTVRLRFLLLIDGFSVVWENGAFFTRASDRSRSYAMRGCERWFCQ